MQKPHCLHGWLTRLGWCGWLIRAALPLKQSNLTIHSVHNPEPSSHFTLMHCNLWLSVVRTSPYGSRTRTCTHTHALDIPMVLIRVRTARTLSSGWVGPCGSDQSLAAHASQESPYAYWHTSEFKKWNKSRQKSLHSVLALCQKSFVDLPVSMSSRMRSWIWSNDESRCTFFWLNDAWEAHWRTRKWIGPALSTVSHSWHHVITTDCTFHHTSGKKVKRRKQISHLPVSSLTNREASLEEK